MKSYKLRITTPSDDVYDDEALQLSVRVTEGDIAIMAGHIPFVSAVRAGACRVYLPSGDVKEGRCSDGILSVGAECVRLLCSDFEWN